MIILNKEESEGLDYILKHRKELFSEANKKLIELSKGIKKMKTFDKKDVFTCLNAEDAKVYIGKEGYLADSLYNLRNAIQDDENTFELETINDDSYYGRFRSCDSDYMLFLPADKVKEV